MFRVVLFRRLPCAALPARLSPRTLAIVQAALERVLEVNRLAMLAQEICKSLVGKLLESHHPASRQHVEGVPGFQVELHTLALSGTGDSTAGRLVFIRLCVSPAADDTQ